MDSFAKVILASGQTNISNYLLANFTKLGMTTDEFMVYLQVKRNEDRGIEFPLISKITHSTGFSKQKAYQLLHELIHKKLMTINTVKTKSGGSYDQYDFTLMYEKLSALSKQSPKQNIETNQTVDQTQIDEQADDLTVNQRQNVFRQIEQEFGRNLSPMELETISDWIDQDKYQPQMISLALKEAVLNQVYNLKYMDKILFNWRKRNVRTPEDVEHLRQQRDEHSYVKHSIKNKPKIPIFKIQGNQHKE
ncbi:DNA replication protein DnaD [Philodulcilactobacillus myokoensis]|uniref:DNA replication protein DnaD n=1 Tax=Philodulcilactobacillus myokoensis TaxID=2929573 RepID=A0A9W6B1T3_9LACO|nr:DnaD domain protein [Philodulcilactobacillus myokoensis]GLB46843.1 DNA replication protein DnaD [Philodulcilactobacillus myokoensis]